MSYLYETHLHTSQGSGCGRSTGAEHARYYKEIGFQGIIVTDHFWGGNTAVPRDLPWKERVDWFCSGYEDAYAEGQKIGLDVFFGWEQCYNGDDEYLIYGLDKAWLLAHPEIEHATRREQIDLVHKYGGCVVQAHPFRTRDYIKYVRLGLMYCDGAEVANGGNHQPNDACAYRYAKAYGLPMTAGSDNHFSHPGMQAMGVALENKLGSIHDFVRMIRSKEPFGLHVPAERWEIRPDSPFIDAYFLNEQESLVPTGKDWLRD